jgi:hypothetical protein
MDSFDKLEQVGGVWSAEGRDRPSSNLSTDDTGHFEPLGIPIRLTPSVFIDDISERNTADWPKTAHWVADRYQGIEWTPGGKPSAASASFSNCKYSVVRVAPRPSARAVSSMFWTAG